MLLSENLIIRKVDKFAHILNPYTGSVVTLHLDEFKQLNKTDKKDIDQEILETIKIPSNSMMNSRLFRSSLINLGFEYSFPTIVNIEITRRCLLDCKHCYISSEEHTNKEIKGVESLSKREVFQLIKKLRDLGVFLVVLTGGEPCISKNIKYFIQACHKYNMTFEIFSSLQIIPEWFNNTLINLARIQVSIYSTKDNIHDFITQKSGSLKHSLENINKLKNIGFYIEIATPLMNINFDDRKNITKYFKKLGIKHNLSWPILNEYYSTKTNKSLLNISKEDFALFAKETPDYIIDCKWDNKDKSLCEAGISVFSISADGKVFPCSQYPLEVGNIFENDIKEIYNGNNMKEAISYKPADLCEDCEYYNFCIGNNYSETGDPLKQPTFMAESLKYAKDNLKRKEVKIYENKSC